MVSCNLQKGKAGRLESTPFYAESGGQVSDTGSLSVNGKELSVAEAKAAAGYILHVLSDDMVSVSVGDSCAAQVDLTRRSDIMTNHTMTHVVNFALREILGNEPKRFHSRQRKVAF